jgi:hypothetical protein
MSILRSSLLVSFVVSASLLTGCGKSGKPSGDPESRTGTVESALESPSGTVDSGTAKFSLVHSQGQSEMAVFGALLDSISIGKSGDLGKCASGTGSVAAGATSASGSVDVACALPGEGSGRLDFSTEVKSDSSGSSVYAELDFHKVCKGSVCVDGSIASKVEASGAGSSVVTSVSADITRDGKTMHVDLGAKVNAGVNGSNASVVLFDDNGDSYVVSSAVGGANAAGSTKITGANGTFSCDFNAGGDKGKCSGDASFSW